MSIIIDSIYLLLLLFKIFESLMCEKLNDYFLSDDNFYFNINVVLTQIMLYCIVNNIVLGKIVQLS